MGLAIRQSAIAIGFCFPIIGGILVAGRFYSRWHHNMRKQIDDWLCLPAWLFTTACCASLLTGVFKDVFVEPGESETSDITEQQRILAQTTGALVLFWLLANTTIRLSILFFYRRIFVGRYFDVSSWTLIGLSILWLVYAFIAWLLYCGSDIEANFEGGWQNCDLWGLKIQMPVFCLDSLIDFCLIALPLPFVWRLNSSPSRKAYVVLIFIIGGLAFVAGLNNTIVQLLYLVQPETVENASSEDFFLGSFNLFNWPVIEIGVGLVTCNLPSLSADATHSLPRQLRRRWRLFRGKQSKSHVSVSESGLNSDRLSLDRLGVSGSSDQGAKLPASPASISVKPLVALRAKGSVGDEENWMDWDRRHQGSDVV